MSKGSCQVDDTSNNNSEINQECCSENPDDRPEMDEILERLQKLHKLISKTHKQALDYISDGDGADVWMRLTSGVLG